MTDDDEAFDTAATTVTVNAVSAGPVLRKGVVAANNGGPDHDHGR